MKPILVLMLWTVSTAALAHDYTGNDLKEGIDNYNLMLSSPDAKLSGSMRYNAGQAYGFISGIGGILNGAVFCFTPTTSQGQAIAVVDKYVRAHPEEWDQQAGILVARAFNEYFPRCKRPEPSKK